MRDRSTRQPWQMSPFYRMAWRVCRGGFRVFFDWRVYHPERVPSAGPVILAANHASFIDPPMIGCGVQRAIYFLARESLFRIPVVGTFIAALNSVPVDRDGGGGAGLKAILDRLRSGGCILLFPEGTRTADGKIQPVRPGIGLTIIKSDAPVVPARVFGTFEALGRHHWFPRPRPLVLKFGPPIDFADLRAEAQHCSKQRLKAIYLEAAERTMEAIGRLEPNRDVDRFGRSPRANDPR